MTLLLEGILWLALGLLAAAVATPRRLALGALAGATSAVTLASLARSAAGVPWLADQVHLGGLVAAAAGAALGAMAIAALLDPPPLGRSRADVGREQVPSSRSR